MDIKKRGLGKGLDALFNDNAADQNDLIQVKIMDIEPNRDQPRKNFDQAALQELAESIKEHGLIQPIVVKPLTNGTYRIIAGERRWRASRMAGLERVPVVVRDFGEQEIMEVALIENLQREDLNPVEEAEGYKFLMETFGLTQEEVATRVGKSRSAVANSVRLLGLSDYELMLLKQGKITAGHARVILSAPDLLTRERLVELAMDGAAVRELEKIVKLQRPRANRGDKQGESNFYLEVELALKEALHRKVKVSATGEDKGVISIEFYGEEELRDIAYRLGKTK